MVLISFIFKWTTGAYDTVILKVENAIQLNEFLIHPDKYMHMKK